MGASTKAGIGGDALTFLFPYDADAGARTGAHSGKTFRADGTTLAFDRRHLLFQAERVRVRGPAELHDALLAAAEEGLSFVVRGRPAHRLEYLRRTKKPYGDCPAGLAEAHIHTLAFDMDSWPNVWRLDPRAEGEALRAAIIGFLGDEFADLRLSFAWSSSCCWGVPEGEAPATLAFRLWVWGGRRVGEDEARTLCKRLDARVRARLAERGSAVGADRFVVDPKVADCIQPIYIARPRFQGGVGDPMAGAGRWHFVQGSRGGLDVDALLAALPPPTRLSRGGKAKAAPAGRPAPVARPKPVAAPGVPIPTAAAVRELGALREALAARDPRGFLHGCNTFGQARAALEMAALAHRCGGLKPGERNDLSLLLAAAVAASLPTGLPLERVRAEVRAVGRFAVPRAGSRRSGSATAPTPTSSAATSAPRNWPPRGS